MTSSPVPKPTPAEYGEGGSNETNRALQLSYRQVDQPTSLGYGVLLLLDSVMLGSYATAGRDAEAELDSAASH
ncbi:hypothetical protein ABZ682_10045 [Streptomyces griseoviridis]|uniref:hypothetical protein n=1 Tax=Streptomyces griseoviridis TaxID=45398 RepID=UPI0033C0E4D6